MWCIVADPPMTSHLQAGALLILGALLAAAPVATLGAGHLFNVAPGSEASTVYRPDADRLSWERTLAFLLRHLGPVSP